jgi:hypothetical protein
MSKTHLETLQSAFSECRIPFATGNSPDVGDPTIDLYPSTRMEQADQGILFFFKASGELQFVRVYKEKQDSSAMPSPSPSAPGEPKLKREGSR